VTEPSDLPVPSPLEAKDRLEQALFEIRRVIAGQDDINPPPPRLRSRELRRDRLSRRGRLDRRHLGSALDSNARLPHRLQGR